MTASDWIRPDWPVPPGVKAIITTRAGGSSTGAYGAPDRDGMNLGLGSGDDAAVVAANRARLREMLPGEPRWLRQVHGSRVVDAAAVDGVVEADAAVTDQSGTVAVVMVADCMPVLLADERGRCVGVAHAGWRGLAAASCRPRFGRCGNGWASRTHGSSLISDPPSDRITSRSAATCCRP
jgi:polyphenol oxidase